MNVTIECADIKTKADFHMAFTAQLKLPGYYGGNLDALYDCLTSLPKGTTITLLHAQRLIRNLGSFGRAAMNTLTTAERECGGRLRINMY